MMPIPHDLFNIIVRVVSDSVPLFLIYLIA